MTQSAEFLAEAKGLVAEYLKDPNCKPQLWIESAGVPKDIQEQFTMILDFFKHDVKISSHPRYGKNATWYNYKNPTAPNMTTGAVSIGPKTYWYAYERADGTIAVKYSTDGTVFGPTVYEWFDWKSVNAQEFIPFEAAIYNYWLKSPSSWNQK